MFCSLLAFLNAVTHSSFTCFFSLARTTLKPLPSAHTNTSLSLPSWIQIIRDEEEDEQTVPCVAFFLRQWEMWRYPQSCRETNNRVFIYYPFITGCSSCCQRNCPLVCLPLCVGVCVFLWEGFDVSLVYLFFHLSTCFLQDNNVLLSFIPLMSFFYFSSASRNMRCGGVEHLLFTQWPRTRWCVLIIWRLHVFK